MRLQTRLALAFGIGSCVILGGVGFLLWRWDQHQIAETTAKFRAEAWDRFERRYPELQETLQGVLHNQEQVLEATLSLLPSQEQLIQGMIHGDSAAMAQALQSQCPFSGLSVMEAFDGTQGTSLRLSGRLAQWVDRLGPEIVFHGQRFPLESITLPLGPCVDDARHQFLFQIREDLALVGPWADPTWDWHPVSLLLLNGPPSIVWTGGKNLDTAALSRSAVVHQIPLLTATHSSSSRIALPPDQRDLFLTSHTTSGTVQLSVAVSLADLVARLGQGLQISTALVYQGLLLEGSVMSDMQPLWGPAIDALRSPSMWGRAYGAVQLDGATCFIAQLAPPELEGVRLFFLEYPEAPGSALSIGLASMEARARRWEEVFLLCGSTAIAMLMLYGWWLGHRMTRPLKEVAGQIDALLHEEHLGPRPDLVFSSVDEVQLLQQSTLGLYARLEEREQLQELLDAFVAPAVARQLAGGVTHPGGSSHIAAILFADIRGFTSEASHMSAGDTIIFLNSCFSAVAPAIEEHGGLIDKFIGDAVMAIFGAPQPMPNPGAAALAAAKDMRIALEQLNEQRVRRNLKPIAMGWGIAMGEITAGIIGAAQRNNYTALGSVVNLAARLCAVAESGQIVLPIELAKELKVEEGIAHDEVPLKGLGNMIVVRV